MDKLLVSACLLGTPCRYDGKSKADARVQALVGKYEIVPVCPEQLGGLPTPRVPSERRGERVVTAGGRDVTEAYRRGAEAALALCQQNGCDYNSMNPAWVFRSHNDDGKSVIKKYTLLPCIPSFTYTYKF